MTGILNEVCASFFTCLEREEYSPLEGTKDSVMCHVSCVVIVPGCCCCCSALSLTQ